MQGAQSHFVVRNNKAAVFMRRALHRVSLALLLALPLTATAVEPKSFATPEEAVNALQAAVKANDDAALLTLFGDKHMDLVVSSDKAANTESRAKAAAAMQTYHLLEERGRDRRVLLIGDQAWPFPIPIVRHGDRWQFATNEGAEELVIRRIGANERSAIEVLTAYLDAQRTYASQDRDGDGVLQYAQRLGSSPNKHDGLYWPADSSKGEELSPFGPLVAQSAVYLKGRKAGDPYHGYHFRILGRQGKSAAGGAYGYVINGRMIAGFAMVAYPAQYGESGVMTIIVNQNGKIFEKDLGPNSTALGVQMTSFDPGAGWRPVTP